MNKVEDHYDAESKTYGSQYRRDNLMTGNVYPAEYFRLQILIQRISELGLKSIYEVGVGEGTPLTTIAKLGCFVAGCDISEAMVAKAKTAFKENNLSTDLIQWGDIQDTTTLVKTVRPWNGTFDAVIAAGVLPHVANDRLALTNMGMFLRPGGRLFVEFRNKLFSLFTFNKNTHDFMINDLLKDIPVVMKGCVSEVLKTRLDMSLPPVQEVATDGVSPGYDAILSKFHNPFELRDTLESCGYGQLKFHWYHYHAALPMMENQLGDKFRKASIALEHEGSWRGFFLCSAGVIEAVKAGITEVSKE